jgi:hypothetical protein
MNFIVYPTSYVIYILTCNGPVCGPNLYDQRTFSSSSICDKELASLAKAHPKYKLKCDWIRK